MNFAVSRSCVSAFQWVCRAVGISTGICLWGVGSEAVYYNFLLTGGFILVDAAIVTIFETLFFWHMLVSRCCSDNCVNRYNQCCRPMDAFDTFGRAILYTVLVVPCFVHDKDLWLPIVPGLMLLLTAVLYASQHCLVEKEVKVAKVPTFVRFEEEAVIGSSPDTQQQPQLSHQSSFTSSEEYGHMGSRDSGIESSRKETGLENSTKAKKSFNRPRIGRATSSSPDRCRLLDDDDEHQQQQQQQQQQKAWQ